MKTRFRLALWLAVATLLGGCFAHVRTTRENRYFHFPPSSLPWQSLSNGADLYWYYEGYGSAQDSPAPCPSMHLLVRRRGVQPDWHDVAATFESSWSLGEFRQFEPVLSAHHGTTRRVLGTSTDPAGRIEIHTLAPEAGGSATDPLGRRAGVDYLDIWHNSPCHEGQPVPRLVVEDGRGLWIFADPAPGCAAGAADWQAPATLMAFDTPEAFGELLRKPMQLYYLDRDNPDEAEFRMPRMASSDPVLLARRPRAFVAIDQVPLPGDKVFTLEHGRFAEIPRSAPPANTHCHYSEISFFLTHLEDTPNPTLAFCTPFPRR